MYLEISGEFDIADLDAKSIDGINFEKRLSKELIEEIKPQLPKKLKNVLCKVYSDKGNILAEGFIDNYRELLDND